MSVERIRKRVERGIFGIPKKKTVLFSFAPRRGEECLSDSEDSDYYPGRRSSDDEGEDSFNRKAKRKVKRSMKGSQTRTVVKRRRRGEPSEEKTEELAIANGSDILQCFPPEILIKIFQYGVQLESVVKFIPRVSRVCHAWHQAAMDPLLWTEIDLSQDVLKMTQKNLDKLLQKDISCCRTLNLSDQGKLSEKNIETALRAVPSLTSLDLSDCVNIKTALILKVAEICPQLKCLKLCFTADFNNTVGIAAIETLLQRCGNNLCELRLVRISSLKFAARQLFTAIEKYCPNLKVLDLRIIDVVKTITPGKKLDFDADSFFKTLPKLSELRLDGFNIVTKKSVAVGMNEAAIHLKDLKTYSHGYQIHETSDHPVFYRMFGSTSKLQHLDISGSSLVPSRIISSVTEVKEVLLNDMRWRDSEHSNLEACVDVWKSTMKRLELSHNIFVDLALDCALSRYSEPGESYPLQYLDLKATNITPLPLVGVLKNCKDLRTIDLTSCRDLPRGCKRVFTKQEFSGLIKNLKNP